MNPLMLLFGGIPRWLLIGLGTLLLLGGAYFYGYTKGNSSAVARQAAATLEGVQKHVEIQNKVTTLSDPDLDSRLSRWMRDIP